MNHFRLQTTCVPKLGLVLTAWGWVCLVGALSLSGAEEPTAEQLQFFESKIRPVLVTHCYECHAADSKTRQGGLLVDSRDGLLNGGDSGPAVVPHDLESSLLLSALRYDSFEMPPKGKLPAAVIADFEKWIQSGAVDPRTEPVKVAKPRSIDIEAGRQHWAYRPIQKPPLPSVARSDWPLSDIDRFILAKLEANGLQPVADADRATLLRRLSFTLTGLPPTPEQLDAFVRNEAPDAYEQVVDQLLGSPRFGERWGRHWLDIVRFAESVTLRGLILGEAWRYRDYVIDAWNEDRPFNQFVVEQLAGDLLESKTLAEKTRNRIATTFLALGNTNLEEQDKKQLELDYIDEQLDVIGRGLLAQTITCARCHDHKFDPIPTRDYYALAGILKNVQSLEHANVSRWVEVPLPVPAEVQKVVDAHQQAVAQLESSITELKRKILPGTQASSSHVIAVKDLPGVVVDDAEARKVGQWKESKSVANYVGAGYCHDEAAEKGTKTISFIPRLPADGRYEVRYAYTHGTNRAAEVPVTVFSADGEKTVLINQQKPPELDGHFVSLGVYQFEVAGQSFVLVSNTGTSGHVIADAVQFLPVDATRTGNEQPPLATKTNPVEATAQRKTRPASATSQQTATAAQATAANSPQAAAVPRVDADPAELKKQLAALEAELNQLKKAQPAVPQAISVIELGRGEDLAIRIRGNVHNVGDVAPRGVLQVASWGEVPQMPAHASGRLELAQWIVDPQQPLTARVLVNRVWHWLFGAGLVRTVDQFGTTGESPSHPELLDYLTARFVDEGWSVKRLIRAIVLSHTYRLASTGTGPANDPENRFLSRMNRQRLPAESLRDAMLDSADELDLKMGGKTFSATLASDYQYEYDASRRSVYIPVFRNSLPEIFEAFDFANPSLVVGRRDVSTVAPQALFLLNHSFVRKQAEKTAKRLLAESHADLRARIQRAYLLTLSRPATESELQLAEPFLRSVMQTPSAAETLGSERNADTATDADTTTPRAVALEAWTQFVHALFASVEYRYLR
jgi:cytochrome c553